MAGLPFRAIPVTLVIASLSAGAGALGRVQPSNRAIGLADIVERAVPLREHIGIAHEPVTTTSPKARQFYDQGLAYLHSFVWIEAARSFNEALRQDPRLAMGYLGLSYAL